MFHADERTDRPRDMTKIIVGFRNFSNAPKNSTRSLGEGKKEHMMKGKKGNGNK